MISENLDQNLFIFLTVEIMKLVLFINFIPESPCNICHFSLMILGQIHTRIPPSLNDLNDLRSLVPPSLDHWHPPLTNA